MSDTKEKKTTKKKTTTKAAKQEEKNKYVKGKAKENTNVDLNAVNFKTKDVMKWDKSKKGKKRRTSSGGNISFGGRKLQGRGGTKMRLHRKKGNRSNA